MSECCLLFKILPITLSQLRGFRWNLLDKRKSQQKFCSILVHYSFLSKFVSLFPVLTIGAKTGYIHHVSMWKSCKAMTTMQMSTMVNCSWVYETCQRGIKEATLQQFCIERRRGRTTPRGWAAACIARNWGATASDTASVLHIHDSWQLIEAIDAAAIDGLPFSDTAEGGWERIVRLVRTLQPWKK